MSPDSDDEGFSSEKVMTFLASLARSSRAPVPKADREVLYGGAAARSMAEASPPLVEPTKDEARNGWDAVSLARYRAERERSQLEHADWTKRERPMPAVQNSRYSPFRWRR